MFNHQKNKKRKIYFFLAVIILLFSAAKFFGVYAEAMSSTNYQIMTDSVNVGGVDFSSSTNYELSDTIGENATGESESANYKIYAGYRQMDESSIAVSVTSATVDMSPNIGGISGGQSTGNTEVTVKTDAQSGYSLSIKAGSSPAMTSGTNYFDDYTATGVADPDYNWDIDTANSEFGFSPYNANYQDTFFQNNGSSCNTGSTITDGKCWFGLTASDREIVDSWERTDPVTGDMTKINFQAEINTSGGFQIAGDYSASLTLTAVVN